MLLQVRPGPDGDEFVELCSMTWQAVILPGFEVYDGDTLTKVTLDIGWRSAQLGQSIRLTSSRGAINCPEVTGREKSAGLLVRDAVRRWIAEPGGRLWLRSRAINVRGDHAEDSRGRTVGEIWCDGQELGAWLLEQKLAKFSGPGGKRIEFNDSELEAIVAKLREVQP